MLCASDSQTSREAKHTDTQELHGKDEDTPIPKTALRWKSSTHFVLIAIAVSTIALTALPRPPQCLFRSSMFHHWRSHLFTSPTLKDGFPLSTLETLLLSEPSASRAADWSFYYTSQSHLPGEGKAQGLWTKEKWEDFGIPETEIFRYKATISTPELQRLALIDISETSSPSVMHEAKLMEELPSNHTWARR
jgi:N-acetylated-alpha-linked acidic dipeptidase